MKKYIPEQMVRISRYHNYFPTLPQNVQQDIYQRMAELIQEESVYCDKKNYEHMAQILTSIAMYEVLQKYGHSEKEAYKTVSEQMWASVQRADACHEAKYAVCWIYLYGK